MSVTLAGFAQLARIDVPEERSAERGQATAAAEDRFEAAEESGSIDRAGLSAWSASHVRRHRSAPIFVRSSRDEISVSSGQQVTRDSPTYRALLSACIRIPESRPIREATYDGAVIYC